jgi:hypothetical protein
MDAFLFLPHPFLSLINGRVPVSAALPVWPPFPLPDQWTHSRFCRTAGLTTLSLLHYNHI